MTRADGGPDQGGGPPTGDGWGTHVPGTRPIAGSSPGGYVAPPPGAAAQPGRGRTWLILLVSFLVQLVVVAAAGNTYVVRKGISFRGDHNDTLGAFATLPNVFAWRLTATRGDNINFYPASLFGLLALFVVAALLTLALVRGPITFWRAFVAVFLSVIVGTLANGMVRRGVIKDIGQYRPTGKAVGVLFQGTGYEVMAGVITGLLAALVTAIVAVASRRPAEAVVPYVDAPEAAPYVEPPPPPPWHGDDVRPAAYAPSSSLRKPQADDAQATTRFAAVPATAPAAGSPDESSGATTQLRRQDDGQYGPPTVVRREQERADPPADTPPAESAPAKSEPAEAPSEERAADERAAKDTTDEPVPPARSDQATQALPAQPAQPSQSPHTTQSTQAMRSFPRPPDDEDLGHHPDDD